jgi:hypothetical protein
MHISRVSNDPSVSPPLMSSPYLYQTSVECTICQVPHCVIFSIPLLHLSLAQCFVRAFLLQIKLQNKSTGRRLSDMNLTSCRYVNCLLNYRQKATSRGGGTGTVCAEAQ